MEGVHNLFYHILSYLVVLAIRTFSFEMLVYNLLGASLVGLLVTGGTAIAASSNQSTAPFATKINFALDDILDGDDGLPPHPLQPLIYGKPVYPRTVDGNGLEMIESHLGYWEGRYWLYSATWGCGSLFLYSKSLTEWYPARPDYPPGDYGADGNCGIKTFSSLDLTNWQLEDFYQPSITVANVTKPVVRYSNETEQYVMIMGGDGLVGLYYATSSSPGGPWSSPPGILGGEYVSHDFDIFTAPNGTHYILTDVNPGFLATDPHNMSTWSIYIQELAPNLTTTVGTTGTMAEIRSSTELHAQGLNLEASSAFYHEGYYYLLFGMTCQNCPGYVYGYFATQPLGPYTDMGMLSTDGCTAQNKGASVLPTPDGGTVVINHVLGYRTGPTNQVVAQDTYQQAYLPTNNYIWHADNHQAAASTYWFPLEFHANNRSVKQWTCPAQVTVPLVTNGNDTATGAVASPDAPVAYQLDCRVRNWRSIEATYGSDAVQNASSSSSSLLSLSTLQFPVWQRTDNLGPTTNAGPKLNGPLNVTLTYADGETDMFSWPASNISWAPAKISMDVQGGKAIRGIALSTNATNGCYGTMVQPKVNAKSNYTTVIAGLDSRTVQEKSELYVYQW